MLENTIEIIQGYGVLHVIENITATILKDILRCLINGETKRMLPRLIENGTTPRSGTLCYRDALL